MSVTHPLIQTNRLTAGSADIGTLSASLMVLNSTNLTVTNLTANTVQTNNLSVAGVLSGPTISDISLNQANQNNDISVNSTRIADVSDAINAQNTIVQTLSGEIHNIQTIVNTIDAGSGITDLSNTVAGLESDVSDLSGRVGVIDSRLVAFDVSIGDLSNTLNGVVGDVSDLTGSITISNNRIGIRTDPTLPGYTVTYYNGSADVSSAANVVIGLSSDTILFNGPTTFANEVRFQQTVSVPANTTLIDTSGVTNIDFLSTTPYSHTEYVMFDTSELHALQYYELSMNPYSSELHLRFSKLSKSRNIFISAPPATLKRLVFELYDDDNLTTSSIVRSGGNIIVQPGATPFGYGGQTESASASNAEQIQDYSSDPYQYLYDLSSGRGDLGRFFYNQAVVIPITDVSAYIGTTHPNLTGNRMDISFYPDVSNDISGLSLMERYHRYYQTGSYQFNVEFISTGQPSLRNNAHLQVREISRIRPLRYAEQTNNNIATVQARNDELQTLIARLIFLSDSNFTSAYSSINTILDGL